MAYELSSSFTSGVTPQSVVGTSGGQHSGGRFSPDGSKIGVQNKRQGGAGSFDAGIDFYESGSGGWARTESLNANESTIRQFVWYSDSIIFAIEANKDINQYNSGSGGWSFTRQVVNHAGSTISDIVLSPSKTRALIYGDSITMVQYTVSTSQAWDVSNETSTDPDRQRFSEPGNRPDTVVKSAVWIDDDNFFIGGPEANSNRGKIQRYERNSGTGLFQKQEDMNASPLYDFGDALMWHASSSALVVGGGTSSDMLSLHVIPSSSAYGFLPASNPQNFDIEIDVSSLQTNDGDSPPRRLLHKGLGLRIDPKNGNRIIGATQGESGSPYDDGVLFSLESGSSGWKVKQFFNNHADISTATERNVDIYNGTIVANNNVLYNADDTFLVWNAIAADPALNSSVTESITTSGGTVKAGGTESSPDVTVTIPANALSATTSITADISGDSEPLTNGLSKALNKAKAASKLISLTPHGTMFNSAVTIQFDLTDYTAGTKIYKRNGPSGTWYGVPENLYNRSGNTITIKTTTFSDYQAVTGDTNMARTLINNKQLAKLTAQNKVLGTSIDITGSGAPRAAVLATDMFLLQPSASGVPLQVSASVMQDFFSKVDVTASNANVSAQLVFHGGADGDPLARDTNLTYNASSNTLTAGTVSSTNVDGILGANSAAAATVTSLSVSDGNITNVGIVEADTIQSDADASGLNINFDGDSGADKISLADSQADALSITDGSADFLVFDTSGEKITLGKKLEAGSVEIEGSAFDIDGGTIDGATLGGSSQVTITNADMNGGSIDGVIIGAASAQAGTFAALVATSADINGVGDFSDTLTLSKGSGTALTVDNGGAAVFNGNVDIGNATSDTLTITARLDADLDPAANGTISLGSTSLRYATGAFLHTDTVHFTASHARIDNLDVYNINSVTQTETTLEIVDKKILAASGSASAQADGGGLQIGGHSAGDDVASILYDHSNLAIDFNIAGTTEVRLENGKFLPNADDDIDLGETGLEFKDLYLDGIAYVDQLGTNSDRVASAFVTALTASGVQSVDIKATGEVSASLFVGNGSGLTNVGATSTEADATSGVNFYMPFLSGASAASALHFDRDLKYSPTTGIFALSGGLNVGSDLVLGSDANEFTIAESSNNITLTVGQSDADLTIVGKDGASNINALAFDMSDAGKATFNGVVVADAGVKADNLTLDGTSLALSSGDLTLDGAGDIILEANGDEVIFHDGGQSVGHVSMASDDLTIKSLVSDKDLIFQGNDGGSPITALTLDMSEGGDATFADKVTAGSSGFVVGNATLTTDELDISSGDFTIDGAGAIVLDSTSGITLKEGGSNVIAIDTNQDVLFSATGGSTSDPDVEFDGYTRFDGTAEFDGSVDIDGAVTLDNASVTFSALADLTKDTVAAGDKFIIQDADAAGVAKEMTMLNLGGYLANTGSSSQGIQADASTGRLSISYVEQVLVSGSAAMSADMVTASLSGEPLDGSLQVFLNGMLQTKEGTAGTTFDYAYVGGSGARKVQMLAALDSDDVLVLNYIKK